MLPVPHSITATADEIGFGEVEQVCRQAWVPTLWISLTFFGGLGALFAWATTLTPEPGGRALLGGISLACWLMTAYGLWDTTRLAGRRFYRCAGGLLLADRVTRVRRAIAWREVDTIRRYQIASYTEGGQELHHRCRLRLTDGTGINLERPPLSDGDAFCAAVEARVAEARLPGVVGALTLGKTVSFGPITTTRDGVACRGAALGWDDIGGVRVRRVRVRFLRQDGTQAFRARVRDVDNLAVLLAVAAQHRIRISA